MQAVGLWRLRALFLVSGSRYTTGLWRNSDGMSVKFNIVRSGMLRSTPSQGQRRAKRTISFPY